MTIHWAPPSSSASSVGISFSLLAVSSQVLMDSISEQSSRKSTHGGCLHHRAAQHTYFWQCNKRGGHCKPTLFSNTIERRSSESACTVSISTLPFSYWFDEKFEKQKMSVDFRKKRKTEIVPLRSSLRATPTLMLGRSASKKEEK